VKIKFGKGEKMSKVVRKIFKLTIALILTASMLANGAPYKAAHTNAATSVSGVPQIPNLPNDFIRGVDISTVLALENSGVRYKYLDGSSGDIFDILAGAGVNYVRIRIWNNPYDSAYPYKGYGGGNCDLYTAKVLGKRATDAGMKVLIDFHYSDFWADPGKQYPPKDWANYSLAYKKDAIYNYTYWALSEMINYGVNVGMVQIGNETNGSMCGVGGLFDGVWNLSTGVADLMKQGCYAINDINSRYGKNILKVLHFTRLVSDGEWYAEQLSKMGVNYDVFAASFYPCWDGTVSEMTTVLTNIARKYNKKVLVAETAYPYTFDDADGSMNTIYDRSAMRYANYDISISGQAMALYDVFRGIAQVNNTLPGYGLGAFYWEPAWIGTPSSAWGTYGTGWASSASGNYELLFKSTVEHYSTTDQGSSWDNMTLFDRNGKATTALYVFNDIRGAQSRTGSNSSGSLDGIYYIKSYHSGLYLDVADGSSANNAKIQQYNYLGTARQKFKLVKGSDGYYTIYTGASGYSKVVDIASKSTADGADVIQYTANGGANQKFEIVQVQNGVYAIKTRITNSASCLDVYNWSTSPGGKIVQWTYWGGGCQLWYLETAE